VQNDMITWLLEGAEEPPARGPQPCDATSPHQLCWALIDIPWSVPFPVYGPIKFISLTQDPHALFHLAGRWDEYAVLLRDEATTVVARRR
jgi:hypothetical protein